MNPIARRPYSPRAARRASSMAASTAARICGRAFEQRLAGGRELDAARGPVEERLPELGLEAADLLRQRRLGDVQAFGGTAEVPLLGHGEEVAQVPQLHGSASAIHIRNIANQHLIGVALRIARSSCAVREGTWTCK